MRRAILIVSFVVAALAPALVHAQSRPWARVSFFAQTAVTSTDQGDSTTFSELVTTVRAESRVGDQASSGYGLDLRLAGYPTTEERAARTSIYEAYFARRVTDRLEARVGQVWINELGALGSLGGALVEARGPSGRAGRLRVGVFGGWEPRVLDAGWVPGVTKLGGYVALDGDGARRHVVGYVNLRNQGLTERSVLSFTNYLPAGRDFFLYQAAELDLAGPGGEGHGGLTYFFVNARAAASKAVELQGTYHRGRSIDTRSIVDQIVGGRPIDPRALEGLLYQSVGGRVTVKPLQGLRIYAGYAVDRTNRDDNETGRLTLGLFASNLGGSGLDLTVSDSRTRRGQQSSYDAWYVSVGRNVGPRVYLTGDFSTSLSVLRITPVNGFEVETRPRTSRVGLSSVINVGRAGSVLATIEATRDGTVTDLRTLTGFAWRF